MTPAMAKHVSNLELYASQRLSEGDTFDVNVSVAGIGVSNVRVKPPLVHIIYPHCLIIFYDMSQYGVSKTITVKADIGTVELKGRKYFHGHIKGENGPIVCGGAKQYTSWGTIGPPRASESLEITNFGGGFQKIIILTV